MRHLKRPGSVFVILFAFLLSSCAQVQIKNSEWCGDLGEYGASCFNTLNEDGRDIQKDQWDEERLGMICTKADTFADLQASIIKLCKATNRCSFDKKKIIIHFMNNINYIQKLSGENHVDIR
jgi:predicted small secreted protein